MFRSLRIPGLTIDRSSEILASLIRDVARAPDESEFYSIRGSGETHSRTGYGIRHYGPTLVCR